MVIYPFRDFWLDCYSTMLFSILTSKKKISKSRLFLNDYRYVFADIYDSSLKETKYGVLSSFDLKKIEEKLFAKVERIDLNRTEYPIEIIKNRINQGRIVLAGVDLFYWVEETFHYQKNHVLHYSLVFSYDDKEEVLIVLETGESGYLEYKVPYEQAVIAMRAYDDYSETILLKDEYSFQEISKEEIISNAQTIIDSIDYIMANKEKVLDLKDVENEGMLYINDMVQTHMFNMSNRAKVNRMLFLRCFKRNTIDGFDICKEFEKLEKKYDLLKNQCILKGYRNQVDEWILFIKEELIKGLLKEKEIWEFFIRNENHMIYK